MRVLILGATCGTGVEIVRQTIARGHSVTAFVRSPEKLSGFAGLITVKQGNPLDSSALRTVAVEHDAVLSAFGPRVPIVPSDQHLLRDFAVALSKGLREAGVKRVILESAAFLVQGCSDAAGLSSGKVSFPEWTLLRPPKLTDGEHTGRYRVRKDIYRGSGFLSPARM